MNRSPYRNLLGLAVLSVCALATSLRADTVELDNGSKITGTIVSITAENVQIETDFAGTLTLERARVTSFSSSSPVFVSLQSGSKLYGTVQATAETTTVETQDGTMNVKPDSLLAVWPMDGKDPLAPAPPAVRKWSYAGSFDLVGKTGNTERISLGGGIKATLAGPEDKLVFYGRGARAKDSGVKTVEEIIGGMDFERLFPGGKHSWYTRVELENDTIEQIDLRTMAGLGYGYYFLNQPEHVLRGRVGLIYRHEDYKYQESKSSPGLDFGLHHDIKLRDWGRLVTDATYTPSFEEFQDYRFYHESALELPLGATAWKLRLGVANEYNSKAPEDVEKLDTTYFTRLVLNWN